ncbi:Glycosylphosphatidylinositol anchor attachment 1 protein-like [Homarus americanus]|uniref:Glycosylphosphatidylinositol anchor attachment 1 protein-like n=1 Tax=Homarus americanus TaxID=6706 RepID=A0A8J5N0I6_HOMAM|nr:Glycosylphosphatidylinositol anchor attachment 1 protein-like [Homarus americanus]
MGLLTDPGMERSQLPALLEKYHRPICVILYVVGIVWFMALAHNSLNHGTYFSENALLPGLVQGDFHGDSQAVQYLESLTEEAEKHASGMPYPWLAAQFTQLGLDTFTHNFTLHYPMGKDKIFTGKNVYGILRASRGSSTEAVVAAINLELHSSHVSHIDVKVEGLNGQLPNLDLVNLIHRLCQRENVHHTFKNRLQTLLAMVASQASGVPTGNHGLFHRYGIAAVTVEGQQQQGRGWRSVSLHQLGRVLEGVCRSLNNLLERFHQSFFFYLLPATNRYISIGVYMPPFGMIAGGVLVKALALWYSTSCAAEEQHQNKNIKKKVDYGLLGCVPLVVLMHLVSVAVSCGPPMLSRCGLIMALSAEDSVFLGTAAFCLTLLVLPSCINRYMGLQERSWEIVKIFAVLELGVLLFAGAVYNFSLALIITIAFTPVALITSPSKSRMKWCLKSLLLILVHPLSMLFLFVMLDTWQNFSQLPINKLLWKSYIATKRALMYSVVDSLIYSNWVFDVATQCLLPVWLLFWQIVHYPTP